ncbi:PEP/pyruvate-binding domain-containing protein [Arthrobacter sp. ISL-65]|uniref:PEP/pyruvate-binding domain-containing protein n=1 Tax=Arthrobacter sp. ISL-65 TaxID=2819112 RepID=UPI001BE961D7|nr:PEP/pyruvate-binding domain-containing protein [Arthrobacter sp. ISL-65]MBT2546974.1 phosphoenolpyruvate synthase [Arthrobacter sp. ISL-65]
MTYIKDFDQLGRSDLDEAGGKGANLGELARAGFPVPPGFVLTTPAYQDFVNANGIAGRILELAALPAGASNDDYEAAARQIRSLFTESTMPEEIGAELRAAYGRLSHQAAALGEETGAESSGDHVVRVAVRSSATAEDLASASFAGQQDTYLNVAGPDAVAAAVINCWASLWNARAMAYRARNGFDPSKVRLAVVIQEMVDAGAAGVLFTANPATGRRDEVVISAAWGLGESVVSGAVTTDDVIVDAPTGRVGQRRTADKDVMTVYDGTGTKEQPVPEGKRRAPVLGDDAAAVLARQGTAIAQHFGVPQDIEWAQAAGDFFILQARPITALPEPSAEAPTEWPLPYPNGMYFRASIVEQLPDPLSPLFADLIDGAVVRSLNALMAEAVGKDVVRPGDVSLPTINGYAYYYYNNAGMRRVLGKTPRAMLALVQGKAHMGIKGWRDHSHPTYRGLVKFWAAKQPADRPAPELLAGISALLDAGAAYYTAVQSIIPIAATSEIMFRSYYDKLVRRPGDPSAEVFLLGYDSEPIRAEKSLYDLAGWTRERPQLASAITEGSAAGIAEALRSGTPPSGPRGGAGVDQDQWDEWRSRLQRHLDRYGHAVYNLDFVNPVPADDPSALLETLRYFVRGQGKDPHERQRRSADRREEQGRLISARLGTRRRAVFRRLLRWAQKAAPVREDALADVGLAWPLMRRMLLELGERLTASSVIAAPSDIFWLRVDELRNAIDFGLAAPGAAITGTDRPVRAEAGEQRKMLWRGQRKAAAPQLLPESRWMERAFGSMMPARTQQLAGDVITGVGASSGHVSAPARLLHGPDDFASMQPGEVLVARMTTPAWTPLFAMAAGVVTDVGGPLSHSSIVAREYGIPAVLGTGVATQRVSSGQQVTVDGDAGTVTLDSSGTAERDGALEGTGNRPSR